MSKGQEQTKKNRKRGGFTVSTGQLLFLMLFVGAALCRVYGECDGSGRAESSTTASSPVLDGGGEAADRG